MELVIPETYSAIHLPLEVTELIIDEVANANDKETLRSFALVSRSFVFQCQRRLFHTIDLGDRCIPGQEYYRRLLRVLSRRPGFCDHVRDLRLVDTYVWDHQKNWKWLVTEDSVCDVLDLLPNIRSFSLKFNTGKPTWSMFKPCIRHSLSQLTKRPMLRSYSLSHIIDFPSSLLVTFSGVKHLELNDVAVDGLNSAASFDFVIALASVHRPSLESLILRAPSLEMVRQLCKVLSIYPVPTLKTLLVSLVDEQDRELMTELWTLLQWAADSLTHLEWRTSTRPRTPALRPPEPIHLGILHNLRTIHFLVNFHSDAAPVFSELLSLLDQISSGPRFTELVIQCMFMQVAELVACGSDWSALDAMLVEPKFCGLKSVVFSARLKLVKSLKASAKTILMEQLPGARASGMLIAFDMDLL